MAPPSSLVNKSSPIKNTFLFILLGLVVLIVLRTFSVGSQHEKSQARSAALIQCYRAEMLMHFVDAMSSLPSRGNNFGLGAGVKTVDAFTKVIKQAEDFLDKAYKAEPNDVNILVKNIIFKKRINEDIKCDLNELGVIINSNEKHISEKDKDLASAIYSIYSGRKSNNLNAARVIETHLPDSWFREQALLKAYELSNENAEIDVLRSTIATKTRIYILKIVMITIGFTIAALCGSLILLYQAIISFKQTSKVSENSLVDDKTKNIFDWQTVAFVFVAWFFTQIAVGALFMSLKQRALGIQVGQGNSLMSALSIGLIYALSNGPALLYIYFFALRPHGQKFLNGLNLRFRVNNNGSLSLVIIGFLTWLAAFPLVIAAYFISATFFGSSGSSNPIIAIVMDAAQANSSLTVVVFYIILGVLAPLCEESLFRGFFYSYLRSRHGMLFANVISSGLFAIAHMDIGAVLPLFCLGCIFACAYEKTNSILPAMIAHGLWNSATFTLVLLLFGA